MGLFRTRVNKSYRKFIRNIIQTLYVFKVGFCKYLFNKDVILSLNKDYIKMVKVLHVAQAAGGVAKYLAMLFKYMDRSKITNILVCSKDYPKEEFLSLVDHIEYLDINRSINFFKDYRATLALRSLIKKYNPDIIYLHSSKAGAVGRLSSFGLGKKIVYNAHGWAYNMNGSYIKKIFYKYIEKLLATQTDRIITISEFEEKSALINCICPREKIKTIENGIDLDFIYNTIKRENVTRESLGIPKDSYIIGMVGRISEQKAPDIFIKAASIILNKIPNSFFIIVGDGEQRGYIESLIHQYDLKERFLITGWIPNPIEYIHLFDQAVLLSRWEGFGLVLAEYMACKKPIVATNIDAIPSIVMNNKNGLLVPVDMPYKVAEAIILIYSNQDLKDRFINEGIRIVQLRFDIKRVARQHEVLLNSLI